MSIPVIENTVVTPRYNSNNVISSYRIDPNEGYVIHTTNYDSPVFNEETMEETGEVLLGFTSTYISLVANYNFDVVVPGFYTYTDANGMTVNVPINKVGRFEIFAIPASIVPENQIFGGGNNNDHETM